MSNTPMDNTALPPETLEGWYVAHRVLRADRAALRALGAGRRADLIGEADQVLEGLRAPDEHGWSIAVPLAGSVGDVMLVHARPTLDAVAAAERTLGRCALFDVLTTEYAFLSVLEAGLYHITAELARDAIARDGSVGDEEYRAKLAERARAERGSAHVKRRLEPSLPEELPYVCFYPMSKRRDPGANWYSLSLDERSRLMYSHGTTGRRYAGRVQQLISGAIGLDEWEWGVTLFAKDPLDFKRLVTDMRFDEVSAIYASFGRFFVGRRGRLGDALSR